TYDTDKAALQLLLAEWQRTDLTYGWRVATLGAGVTPDDDNQLFQLVWGTTVLDDAGSNALRGGPAKTKPSPAGRGRVVANVALGHDTIADLKTGELVNVSGIAAPTAIGPSGQIVNPTPTFNWTSVPNADSYEVSVLDETKSPAQYLFVQTVTGTSWTLTTPL